jgi:hypothetical protein
VVGGVVPDLVVFERFEAIRGGVAFKVVFINRILVQRN